MTITREPRNSRLSSKPRAQAWFTKNPQAMPHFDLARKLLVSRYLDSYHGFIDRQAAPQYRFNSHGEGYTTITGSFKHATVRFVMSHNKVLARYRRSHCHKMKDRNGVAYDVVSFKISDLASLEVLKNFMSEAKHIIGNFSDPANSNARFSTAGFEAQVKALFKKKLQKPAGETRPKTKNTLAKSIARLPEVKAWILQQVKGKCESCGKAAPFSCDKGIPFLEVHHLHQLAHGGPDTVENAVAVCPNCHRELHFGTKRQAKIEHLYKTIKRLQAANQRI
jgi:5-methylcytosine-specific restriction endonuclease McrA